MEDSDNNPRIVKHFVTLSQSGNVSKELNWVSFYNHAPQISLHTWKVVNGQKQAKKGLTISVSEMKALWEGLDKQKESIIQTIEAAGSTNDAPSSGSMEAITAENPDLEPVGVFWDPVEEAYRIAYSGE